MAPLLISQAGGFETEWRLQLGINRIGRHPENDLQIPDRSVSGQHCEIVVQDDDTITIRDLGSTNGTFVDGTRVQEARLHAGQTIRLGNVELRIGSELDLATAGSPALRLETSAPAVLARPASAKSAAPVPEQQGVSFFRALPTVFKYPFRQRGPVLLVTGTIFFLMLDFATLAARFALVFGLVALLFLTIAGGGFLFSFMQNIITTTASGEDEMPGWPDVSDFWHDLVLPFFRFATIWVVCFGPGILVLGISPAAGVGLLLLGVFCLPMALLAVSMADSISGLNPLVIFPSIMKVPGAYVVACLMLLLVIGIELLSRWILDLSPIPLVPTIIGKAVSLYVLIVEMRVLGLLYRCNERRLHWV